MTRQYSIKEVAKLLGMSTNKIRFYEKKGLIDLSNFKLFLFLRHL